MKYEPQAYLNGDYVSASRAVVSVADRGFVQGATVAEQFALSADSCSASRCTSIVYSDRWRSSVWPLI